MRSLLSFVAGALAALAAVLLYEARWEGDTP
jgi:hypothetical protein